ncbi:MAG: sensor histidine kinase [Ginsengibacter sp.]
MMRKNIRILIFLLFQAVLLNAQPASYESQTQLRFQIQKSRPDTNRIRLMLTIGNRYLSKDGLNTYNPDSAYLFYNEANKLSKILDELKWQSESLMNMGSYYFEVNKVNEGKASFMKAIEYYNKNGDKHSEALCWNRLGKAIPDSDLNNIPFKMQCFRNANSFFINSRDSLLAIEIRRNIAECYLKQGKPDDAEKQLLQVVKEYKAIGYKKLQDTYDVLAQISGSRADLHNELSYRMNAVNSMEATSDTARSDYFYAKLALTYSDTKMYKESIRWIVKAIDVIKKRGKYEDLYGDVSLLVFDYIMVGKPGEALAFLENISRQIPPNNLAQKVDLNEEFAHCYVSMKQYEKAEHYYLEMMRIFDTTSFNKAFYTTNEQMVTDFIYYNQTIGNFYILTKNYKLAGIYYNKILNLPRGSVRPITLGEIHQMQFKVDSASGNYVSAIRHFEAFQNLHDSLFNATKNKQIQELQIKYETDQKDKDLRLKQQDIALLTNKSQLQEVNLKKASLARKIIIMSAIVLLALLFAGYRIKQKHNVTLQLRQDEINMQNQQLQTALANQQKLTVEKEWLVKEIHHRVKNNLQIVISLLNVQSDYLDNPSAINAIQESRERMQAIALIHQKLYQTDLGTSINMRSYIHEMSSYLGSFTSPGKVKFQLDVDDVSLDVSQSVPLGLILNEAITNSLKYAFTGGQRGIITITLQQGSQHNIVLKIKDDGKGFPENFDFSRNKSIGIQLMKLFSEQLEGALQFKNSNGAEVELIFKNQFSGGLPDSFPAVFKSDEESIEV